MSTEPLGRMRTGSSLGRTLYLLDPDDDLAANPKAGRFIGTVDTPELAEAICAAVNGTGAAEIERLRAQLAEARAWVTGNLRVTVMGRVDLAERSRGLLDILGER